MTRPATLLLVALAALAGCGGCDRETGAPSGRPSPTAPVDPPYPETSWRDAAERVERGDVVWIVPARHRRVFLTTTTGEEYVCTAPTDTAVDELVARVDPSHHSIALAKAYAKYEEVRWRDIPALVARHTIGAVQQNGGRRVLIDTIDADHGPNGFYVTLQPRHGAIAALVPRSYPSGLFVKHNDCRDINWKAAVKIMAGEIEGVGLLHFDRVYIHTRSGGRYLTIEPTPEAAGEWLARHRPDFRNITVE